MRGDSVIMILQWVAIIILCIIVVFQSGSKIEYGEPKLIEIPCPECQACPSINVVANCTMIDQSEIITLDKNSSDK